MNPPVLKGMELISWPIRKTGEKTGTKERTTLALPGASLERRTPGTDGALEYRIAPVFSRFSRNERFYMLCFLQHQTLFARNHGAIEIFF